MNDAFSLGFHVCIMSHMSKRAGILSRAVGMVPQRALTGLGMAAEAALPGGMEVGARKMIESLPVAAHAAEMGALNLVRRARKLMARARYAPEAGQAGLPKSKSLGPGSEIRRIDQGTQYGSKAWRPGERLTS